MMYRFQLFDFIPLFKSLTQYYLYSIILLKKKQKYFFFFFLIRFSTVSSPPKILPSIIKRCQRIIEQPNTRIRTTNINFKLTNRARDYLSDKKKTMYIYIHKKIFYLTIFFITAPNFDSIKKQNIHYQDNRRFANFITSITFIFISLQYVFFIFFNILLKNNFLNCSEHIVQKSNTYLLHNEKYQHLLSHKVKIKSFCKQFRLIYKFHIGKIKFSLIAIDYFFFFR